MQSADEWSPFIKAPAGGKTWAGRTKQLLTREVIFEKPFWAIFVSPTWNSGSSEESEHRWPTYSSKSDTANRSTASHRWLIVSLNSVASMGRFTPGLKIRWVFYIYIFQSCFCQQFTVFLSKSGKLKLFSSIRRLWKLTGTFWNCAVQTE